MCNRFNLYIENKNILSSTQFGFRKGISTKDAIFLLLDNAYNSIDSSEYLAVLNILVLDTVNHYILVQNLNRLGFRGIILN